MKIEIKQIKDDETLLRIGNKFFTREQVEELREIA